MLRIVWAVFRTLVSTFRSRRDLLLENMVLRQQLGAFKSRGKRPRIGPADRAFWVLLRRVWARWADLLVIVKPDTVVRWHRAGFRAVLSIFSVEVVAAIKAMGIRPTRTAYHSPWQNGAAERWVGACRQELLDHVVVANEAHLRRLLREYVAYHHDDRTHCGLGKQTPMRRAVQPKPSAAAKVMEPPRIGGLQHRYEWRDAA